MYSYTEKLSKKIFFHNILFFKKNISLYLNKIDTLYIYKNF